MKLILAGVCVLMCAAPLMAETYTWEDESGTVNFTENYSSVPAKYRKKARKLGEMGSDLSPAPSAVSVSGTKAAPEAKAAAGTATGAPGEAGGLYGGKKPEAWQQEMRPLYADLKRLEKRIDELDAQSKKPAGTLGRIEGIAREYQEAQTKYNILLKQYEGLNDEANKVGLPAEFRK
jgi:hypothetical protein